MKISCNEANYDLMMCFFLFQESLILPAPVSAVDFYTTDEMVNQFKKLIIVFQTLKEHINLQFLLSYLFNCLSNTQILLSNYLNIFQAKFKKVKKKVRKIRKKVLKASDLTPLEDDINHEREYGSRSRGRG